MAIKHYLDDIPSTSERVYRIETNGNVSKIIDVTEYEQTGSSFGAKDVNEACVLMCDYEKNGSVHRLSTPNVASENIKFFATAPFRKGEIFTFNGEQVVAQTTDGRPLCSNFFTANTVVECNKRGSILYFASSVKPITDDTTGAEYHFGIENGLMYIEEE